MDLGEQILKLGGIDGEPAESPKGNPMSRATKTQPNNKGKGKASKASKPSKARGTRTGELGNAIPERGTREYQAVRDYMDRTGEKNMARAAKAVREGKGNQGIIRSSKSAISQSRRANNTQRAAMGDNLPFFGPQFIRPSGGASSERDLINATGIVRQVTRYYADLASVALAGNSSSSTTAGGERGASALEMMVEDWISGQMNDPRIPEKVGALVTRFLSERNIGLLHQRSANGGTHTGMQEWLTWLRPDDRIALFRAISSYLETSDAARNAADAEWKKSENQQGMKPYRDAIIAGVTVDHMLNLPNLPGDGQEEYQPALMVNGISEVGNMRWPGSQHGSQHIQYGSGGADVPQNTADLRAMMNRGPLGRASEAELDVFLNADAFNLNGGPVYDLGRPYDPKTNPSELPGPLHPPLFGAGEEPRALPAPARPAAQGAARQTAPAAAPWWHSLPGDDDDDTGSFS